MVKIFACVKSGGGAISDESRIEELLKDADDLLNECYGLMPELEEIFSEFMKAGFAYRSREAELVARLLPRSSSQLNEIKSIINMVKSEYAKRPISLDKLVKNMQDVKGNLKCLKKVLEHLNSDFLPLEETRVLPWPERQQ